MKPIDQEAKHKMQAALTLLHKGPVTQEFSRSNPDKLLAVVREGVIAMEDDTAEGERRILQRMNELNFDSSQYNLSSTLSSGILELRAG